MDGIATVVGTGDIYLDTPDPAEFLRDVTPLLQDADLTIANLEGPASSRGRANPGKIALRMPPAAIDAIARSGVDAVSLANNHGMDFGPEALLDTLSGLERAGIAYAGGGRNEAASREMANLRVGGVRIAFLSATFVFDPVTFPARGDEPGVYCIRVSTSYEIPDVLPQAPGVWPRSVTAAEPADKNDLLRRVEEARRHSDLVVVACHWGLSDLSTGIAMGIPSALAPNIVVDYQHEMGRAIVDAGASLVIGHHPHRLQGVEFYGDALICYSLGNFAFAYEHQDHFSPTAVAVKGYLDTTSQRFSRFSLVPIRMSDDGYVPRIADGGDTDAILQELRDLSAAYGTIFEQGAGDDIEVHRPSAG